MPVLPRVPVDDDSLQEPPGDAVQLPEEQRYGCEPAGTPPGEGGGGRAPPLPPAAPWWPCPPARRLLLALFTVEPRLIPATHPGEPVFCARPLPPPALDTHGLWPRSVLEGRFLW